MKRFEFKLQPLLNFRGYLERVAQENTARANRDVHDCEQHITQLKQSYDQEADTIEARVKKGVSASEFRQHQEYLGAVETLIADERSRKIQLQTILREKLLELNKKRVDKKVMELYRDKLKTEYHQEVMKIEQKELDEISSLKTARLRSNDPS